VNSTEELRQAVVPDEGWAASPVSIDIHPHEGVATSPYLWGLFLEDINNSLDGGLNADLVRNGDFEFSPADGPGFETGTAWSFRITGPGSARFSQANPMSRMNPNYLSINPAGGIVEVTNKGYDDGMVLGAGHYRLRMAGRSEGAPGATWKAALQSLTEAVTVDLPPPTSEWTWIEVDLAIDLSGTFDLTLEVSGTSSLSVDCVSLRPLDPLTREPQLFRQDMVDALVELKPSFIRFPGGCVAHGLGLENMYRWKETIEEPSERRQINNIWGYHQSRRIGYYEFFILCEQLGASPLPVVAAGVCCQNSPGGQSALTPEAMEEYVTEVLDLVEFANGGPTTTWGAHRTRMGHPEPFGLKFLGVGNEDEITDNFVTRFTEIKAAVKHHHPTVQVVGTAGPSPFGKDFDSGWKLARELDVDVVDEHAYRSPRWFLQNLDRYDHYPRQGPSVYLGEWAAKSNTWRSALAEAAFMISLERNSDVVSLASCAPLFARVGGTQWLPDLLYFDGEQVMRTFNYHVQKMFGAHRGELVCPVEVDGLEWHEQPLPSMQEIRLSSPGATINVRGIRMDGHARPDVQCKPEGAPVSLGGADEDLTMTLRRENGPEGLVVEFGNPGTETWHSFQIGGWQNRFLALGRSDDGLGNDIDGPVDFEGIKPGRDYEVRVHVSGASIRCWLDGDLVFDHSDDLRPWPAIICGATTSADASETYVSIVNVGNREREAVLKIVAAPERLEGTGWTLSADPSRGEPFSEAPRSPQPITVPPGVSRFALPAYSVTVMKLHQKPRL
jgi:alpha-L-arabinofuranosidase